MPNVVLFISILLMEFIRSRSSKCCGQGGNGLEFGNQTLSTWAQPHSCISKTKLNQSAPDLAAPAQRHSNSCLLALLAASSYGVFDHHIIGHTKVTIEGRKEWWRWSSEFRFAAWVAGGQGAWVYGSTVWHLPAAWLDCGEKSRVKAVRVSTGSKSLAKPRSCNRSQPLENVKPSPNRTSPLHLLPQTEVAF